MTCTGSRRSARAAYKPAETSADNHDSRHAQRYRTVRLPVPSCQWPVASLQLDGNSSCSTDRKCRQLENCRLLELANWQLRNVTSGIRLAVSSAMTMTQSTDPLGRRTTLAARVALHSHPGRRDRGGDDCCHDAAERRDQRGARHRPERAARHRRGKERHRDRERVGISFPIVSGRRESAAPASRRSAIGWSAVEPSR